MLKPYLLAAALLLVALIPATQAEVVYAPNTQRYMRLAVDLDHEYMVTFGADARANAERWIGKAIEVWDWDANLTVEVTIWRERTAADNYPPAEPTNPTGDAYINTYLDMVGEEWKDVPGQDVVLLLTTRSYGPGVANGNSAGQDGEPRAAIVKAIKTDSPCGVLNNCPGDPERWNPFAILHELGHTIGADHQYTNCGPQDRNFGCDAMAQIKTTPEEHLVHEYSEANEQAIRAYIDLHLPVEES